MSIESRRRGSALLEVQIAFAVLGVGLAGLCPFVVMQYRQLRVLERRFDANVYKHKNIGRAVESNEVGQVYYLVPWKNPWARKLTARALVSESSDDLARDPGDPEPAPASVHIKLKSFETSSVDGATEIDATVELE
jgi:hypothetical protein